LNVHRKFFDLREALYKILQTPAEVPMVRSKIKQHLSIDRDAAEAFAKNGGNIIILQAAQINNQITYHASKALEHLDALESSYYEQAGLDAALTSCFSKGWRLPELLDHIEGKALAWAEAKSDSPSKIASFLGIKRTTYIERKKRNIQRLQEEKKDGNSSSDSCSWRV